MARLAGLLLVASACTGGTAETTTTSTQAATTTTTTSSTTTTTTIPLIENGPPIAVDGDVNETVEALQFLMNCNGYGPITVDGVFGPNTGSTVEEVQADLGREVTGAPDEETLALLSRNCREERRVEIDEEDEGEQIVVENVAPDDPATFFIRVDEGVRFAIVVESDTGEAVVDVRTADGGAVGPGSTRAWAADISETLDYVVRFSATGEGDVTFTATFSIAELEIEDVDAADDGTVVLGETEETITGVCLDTTGENSFVAETASGFAVVTTGRVGTFAVERGGVGAPVEFVYKDGSPGYHGFAIDFEIEVGDQVTGEGVVFLAGSGNSSDPVAFAFAFDRTAAPCEGGEGTPIVLSADGLGVVDFGAGGDEALGFVRSALPGASPTEDTGWLTIDNQANDFGVCRQGTTEVRVITVDNLTMYFSDAGTSFAAEGTRHFVGFMAESGVFPFTTDGGVGPGSTIAEVLAAHPDAVAADGLTGGVDVYISSPPGSDHWLRATALEADGPDDTDATITSVTGGRFCDL